MSLFIIFAYGFEVYFLCVDRLISPSYGLWLGFSMHIILSDLVFVYKEELVTATRHKLHDCFFYHCKVFEISG